MRQDIFLNAYLIATVLLILSIQSYGKELKSSRFQSFRDCQNCPEIVVLPEGSFLMGINKKQAIQAEIPIWEYAQELPQHKVLVKSFAIATHDVTRGEYAKFVEETGYQTKGCRIYAIFDLNGWFDDKAANWRNPGFEQSDQHPVVCVSWDDTQRYVSWLNSKISKTTHYHYRLPSEAEWEYAARAGTTTLRFWGDDAIDQCGYSNGRDLTAKEQYPDKEWAAASCRDGFTTTSPGGSFHANQWGLYDMLGNVLQWTEDCWHHNYLEAPEQGGSWESGGCNQRVVRGGSWATIPMGMLSTSRSGYSPSSRLSNLGFRLARDVH